MRKSCQKTYKFGAQKQTRLEERSKIKRATNKENQCTSRLELRWERKYGLISIWDGIKIVGLEDIFEKERRRKENLLR